MCVKTSPVCRIADLTSRQREIVQLIAEGQTVKTIALMIKRTPKCVEYHLTRIVRQIRKVFRIPGKDTRVLITRYAYASGICNLND